MSREEFIKVLDSEGYSYEIEVDRIVVTYEEHVYLSSLTSLPPGVVFKNGGSVWLRSLTSLPSGVEFKNRGSVYLKALTSLPPGVEFRNGGDVWLESLIGSVFNEWEGNIDGIDTKRLLNLMISKGVFER